MSIMDVEAEKMKKVVFDGVNLIFDVDGVKIKNGKFPETFTIKEDYRISAESLLKLIVALGEGNTCAEFVEQTDRYGTRKLNHTLYPLKDEYFKKVTERIAKLERKITSLEEEASFARSKESHESYKRYLLEKLIEEHNKLPWRKRAEIIQFNPPKNM